MEWSPIAIFACDPQTDFRLTFVSDNVTARLGIPRRKLLDDPGGWTMAIHEDDRRKLDWALRDTTAGKRKKLIYRMECPGRGFLWVQSEFSLVRDANGAPQEIVGYWLDVGDHKEREKQLLADKLAAQSSIVAAKTWGG